MGRPCRGGTLSELKQKFDTAIGDRPGLSWGKVEISNAMLELEATKLKGLGIDPSSITPPHSDTVAANLTALAAMLGVSAASARVKNVHREVAEMSERNLLSNIAGQLVAQTIVGKVPAGRKLPENAPEGCKIGLKLVAAALGISEADLYYVQRHNLHSTDDMALFYYRDQNDKGADMRIARTEDVGKSFAIHERGSTANAYSGVKD